MNKQGGNARPKQLMIHFQSTDPIMHMIVYELKQCYVLASEKPLRHGKQRYIVKSGQFKI